jgi:hypothetical protein
MYLCIYVHMYTIYVYMNICMCTEFTKYNLHGCISVFVGMIHSQAMCQCCFNYRGYVISNERRWLWSAAIICVWKEAAMAYVNTRIFLHSSYGTMEPLLCAPCCVYDLIKWEYKTANKTIFITNIYKMKFFTPLHVSVYFNHHQVVTAYVKLCY